MISLPLLKARFLARCEIPDRYCGDVIIPSEDALTVFLLNSIGIPYDRRKELKEDLLPTWDGRILHVDYMFTRSDAIHEMTHWLVAPPKLRAHPNYGLGSSNEGGSCNRFVKPDESTLWEERASILGIELERTFEQDWELTYHHHGWDDGGVTPTREVATRKWLQKRFIFSSPEVSNVEEERVRAVAETPKPLGEASGE